MIPVASEYDDGYDYLKCINYRCIDCRGLPMTKLDGELPFLWCLGAESSDGLCAVSMVVPYQDDDHFKNLTIETSVLSLSSDSSRSSQGEMLEWNDDDVELFLKMVNQRRLGQNLPIAESLRIDLTDPAIVDIVNIVAAAGFGTAYMVPGLLRSTTDKFPSFHCHLGGFASLNTLAGFKPCAIVDMEDDDVVCVLLDDIELGFPDGLDCLHRNDLLLAKRKDLLHPGFTCEQLLEGSHPLH